MINSQDIKIELASVWIAKSGFVSISSTLNRERVHGNAHQVEERYRRSRA